MLVVSEKTKSRFPILEVCKIRFFHFRDCGGHIFPQFVTETELRYN